MYENLKKLRKSLNMTQAEFAETLGFPQTTYAGYEKGTSDPRSDFWIAVADKYDVSIDWLMGFTDDPKRSKFATPSSLDRKYAALDAHGRRVVDLVIGAEAERVEAQKAAVEETPQEPPRVKIVPLFPAAAGPGEPVDGSVFDSYELPADSPADFAVRISGDSMAPEFQDGEIVLCVKRYPEIGEIAAVMVNGFLLVKQFITDSTNIYLRSLNRRRKNLDVDIWASGSDTVKCYGTVIHKKIPLVME